MIVRIITVSSDRGQDLGQEGARVAEAFGEAHPDRVGQHQGAIYTSDCGTRRWLCHRTAGGQLVARLLTEEG